MNIFDFVYNNNFFLLILDCNDLLCTDFCLNTSELIENCNSKCRKSIYDDDDKGKQKSAELVEFIMNRFFLYRSKNEILFDRNIKKDLNMELNNLSNIAAEKTGKNAIDDVKERIVQLRKKLLDEETNLLNLYKLKS